MDWIKDNLQVIIGVAGVIAYWLNARMKNKAGEPADYDGDGQPDNQPGGGRAMRDHDQSQENAENARRIQEEIRRKRAEREAADARGPGSAGRPSLPIPPVLPRAVPRVPAQPPATPVRRRETELAPYARDARREETEREAAVVLERQRGLAEQLAALQARKAEASREAKSVWTQLPAESGAVASGAGTGAGTGSGVAASAARRGREEVGLLAELRDARSLRKAIVLREVLGTPVGLR